METFSEKTKSMKDIICLEREDLMNTYKNASDEQKEVLRNLFGAETFKPKDIRERIKTFHDAYCELGNDNPYVISYEKYVNTASGEENDVIAFFKLRIIVAALNEVWEPQFIPGERRWAPYFVLYTQDEMDEMDEETKARVVCRSNYYAYSDGGVSYAYSISDSAHVNANIGSRLAFKSKELAEYAGKQFINIFADFMLGRELKNQIKA